MNVDKVRKALEVVCEELTSAYLTADPTEGAVARMNARSLDNALQRAQECTFWVRWLAEPLTRSQEPPPNIGTSFEERLAGMEARFEAAVSALEAKCGELPSPTPAKKRKTSTRRR